METPLTRHIEYLLQTLDTIHNDIEYDLAELIISLVGQDTPMTFNDETTYPKFDDENDTMLASVVGVRVIHDGGFVIEFNCDCGDDEYGLDSDAWFNPKDNGNYDLSDLYECIMQWAEVNNKVV